MVADFGTGRARRYCLLFFSYFWLDRPLAMFLHDQRPHMFRILTQIPDPLIWATALTFFALGLLGLAGRPLSKMQTTLLVCSLSLLVAETIKNYLKFVFGRTWPETWYQNNPSFIRDGIYGFNWFHEGAAHILSLWTHDCGLRGAFGPLDLLPATASPLCGVWPGRPCWARRRQFSLSQ